MSNSHLQEAISIFKSGHRDQARALFEQVVQQDPQQELAWLYLAACLDVPDQVRSCLERALAISR